MATIKVKDVTRYLETLAPPLYQEEYDNSGLLTGNPDWEVTGVLVCLDCLEAIVDEAVTKRANLIVTHHPVIFRGLKKLTGQNHVERTVIKAIKNDIAIFAIHTNLDNVDRGVNKKIAEKIGLENTAILAPRKDSLLKLTTFAPGSDTEKVLGALHAAGAGHVGNYSNCSFRVAGTGSFTPGSGTAPHIGKPGRAEQVEEIRIDVLLPRSAERAVLTALRLAHPYEEVAYYLTPLENENQQVGAGMIGDLRQAMEPIAFLNRLKSSMNAACVRHTTIHNRLIKRVAVCGGGGSFLLDRAIDAGADAFVSADFKYHEFMDAEDKILVADIGHYESESFTKELLQEVLKEKFPKFAITFSEYVTNPISYL